MIPEPDPRLKQILAEVFDLAALRREHAEMRREMFERGAA